MIGCRRCDQQFAPTASTYVGTQIFAGVAVLALHNCPNIDANGEVCGSTAALKLWSDCEDQEPIAAE